MQRRISGQSPESAKRYTGVATDDFAAAHGTKMYADPAEMIRAEGIDLAFVCAHDADKVGFAEMAARAGCHVYVAKPVCLGTAEALRLAAVAKETGRTISTLEPGRYDGAIRETHRRVRAGEIGEVLSARAWIQHGQPGNMDYSESVEFSPTSGGTLYSLGVYAAGLLNWFIDAPAVEAFAIAANMNTPWYPHPDQIKATVRYENGRLGSTDIYFSTPCSAPAWEIEVVGRTGIIRVNQDVFEGTLYASDGRVVPFYRNQNDVIHDAIGRFLSALAEGREPDLTLAEAVEFTRLCEAWGRSIESGKPVKIVR